MEGSLPTSNTQIEPGGGASFVGSLISDFWPQSYENKVLLIKVTESVLIGYNGPGTLIHL